MQMIGLPVGDDLLPWLGDDADDLFEIDGEFESAVGEVLLLR